MRKSHKKISNAAVIIGLLDTCHTGRLGKNESREQALRALGEKRPLPFIME